MAAKHKSAQVDRHLKKVLKQYIINNYDMSELSISIAFLCFPGKYLKLNSLEASRYT